MILCGHRNRKSVEERKLVLIRQITQLRTDLDNLKRHDYTDYSYTSVQAIENNVTHFAHGCLSASH